MNKQKKKKQLNKYLQLTGVAFQMGLTIYLGVYFGKKLDIYFQTTHKTYTIILTLVSLVISIYSVIAQLKSINDKYD
ncbi:AtpZ/AtpI family protein [Lutibacter maritimus]|jgi:membrane protein DedA with SNARE-associated domain|uniref:Putative F0F1-ATPase subunit Ca2+/Mg2+ transporter n=1 Tax=Lutibacter maritimus TaxID=593133 RepID=A0A1I6PI07_9FLAO|nr:AtpZ/AtpI family protein [Lutibacter maritimus]SFS39852.1 Putative F0F1-ATPase subunit Ca2+/Mg2+ transporter [Lutibacter maritimus]